MRALFALVLLIPMAAEAGPRHGLRLPADALHERHPADPKVTLAPYRPPPAATQPMTMNIGPFEAEIGGGHHFAHYRLEGTRILGGSLGGSFSGHSAKVELIWKNE
jgi:hypothetical protein